MVYWYQLTPQKHTPIRSNLIQFKFSAEFTAKNLVSQNSRVKTKHEQTAITLLLLILIDFFPFLSIVIEMKGECFTQIVAYYMIQLIPNMRINRLSMNL